MIDLQGPSILLAAAGVARVSLGAALAVATYQSLHRALRNLTTDKTPLDDTVLPGWMTQILEFRHGTGDTADELLSDDGNGRASRPSNVST